MSWTTAGIVQPCDRCRSGSAATAGRNPRRRGARAADARRLRRSNRAARAICIVIFAAAGHRRNRTGARRRRNTGPGRIDRHRGPDVGLPVARGRPAFCRRISVVARDRVGLACPPVRVERRTLPLGASAGNRLRSAIRTATSPMIAGGVQSGSRPSPAVCRHRARLRHCDRTQRSACHCERRLRRRGTASSHRGCDCDTARRRVPYDRGRSRRPGFGMGGAGLISAARFGSNTHCSRQVTGSSAIAAVRRADDRLVVDEQRRRFNDCRRGSARRAARAHPCDRSRRPRDHAPSCGRSARATNSAIARRAAVVRPAARFDRGVRYAGHRDEHESRSANTVASRSPTSRPPTVRCCLQDSVASGRRPRSFRCLSRAGHATSFGSGRREVRRGFEPARLATRLDRRAADVRQQRDVIELEITGVYRGSPS